MASSSASSTDCELTDYDSSSSVEIVVNKKKLNEELKKEMEEDRKIAAEKGLPTYEDGTRQKFDKKGNVRNEQTVRFERFMSKFSCFTSFSLFIIFLFYYLVKLGCMKGIQ